MDPPSPSKLAMSPGMPIFPISPERAVGTKTYYADPAPMPPSTPTLRSYSPLRNAHRRNDSDVSVQGLAVMFESLEVKDPREASFRFKAALEKEKARNADKLNKIEKEHSKREKEHEMALDRRNVRIEELQSELEAIRMDLQVGVSKTQYEKERKAHKANVAQWEKVFKQNEDKWRSTQANLIESNVQGKALEGKYREYKKKWMEANKENLRQSSMVPTLQTKIHSLQRNVQRAESDAKFKSEEAAKYQNTVYSLQVELEGLNARLTEEVLTLKDKLRLIEGERDALKTSLKEEEVMRIAAEGHIALPATADDEDDEFGSPASFPHNSRQLSRGEDDKENVSPKKSTVEIHFLQQELAVEKRLRERAQNQIEFMKMECQFECCSCRLAENKGKQYVSDDMFATEMQRIKLAVSAFRPLSITEEDQEEKAPTKEICVEKQRPLTPSQETLLVTLNVDDSGVHVQDNTIPHHPQISGTETVVTFSPCSGTFKSIPSPSKANVSTAISTSAKPVQPATYQSSPWTPDAHSTMLPTETVFPLISKTDPKVTAKSCDSKENRVARISIHEDIAIESDGEDAEPLTPTHEPSGAATPYYTRTFTTTTTIPMHFSPATPALKPSRCPITPSTVAHAPENACTPVLGELSLNNLPFDRDAALEAIRQRRGRARSMAAGHRTPMRQMVQGTKDRRDISAPVSRTRG